MGQGGIESMSGKFEDVNIGFETGGGAYKPTVQGDY